MPVKLKLSPFFQGHVKDYDLDKGIVLENAVGKTVRQIAAELAIPLEELTCSIMINHLPSGRDHIVRDGDLIALVRLLGGG